MMAIEPGPPIERLVVSSFAIPTESTEADGTFSWNQTTLVLVEVEAGGVTGIGYSYADHATAVLIHESLRELVIGRSAFDVGACWQAMLRAIRNLGRPGICSMAIAAVDSALWDLKARLLGLSLVSLLGGVRESLPVYGSGGFTNYSIEKLQAQLGGWVEAGISRVKMKIGRNAEADIERVMAAREAIGAEAELFVDANGGYTRKLAIEQATAFQLAGVSWFEEPVSSDDLEGLRQIRNRLPGKMELAAGEYGYESGYFRRMLEASALDVLQADATRCAGISGFLQAGALCEAFQIPMSSHCAPALHVHPGCAVAAMRHAEYFFDHVRIEEMLFEGSLQPRAGVLTPDRTRLGHGLTFKHQDAEQFRVRGT